MRREERPGELADEHVPAALRHPRRDRLRSRHRRPQGRRGRDRRDALARGGDAPHHALRADPSLRASGLRPRARRRPHRAHRRPRARGRARVEGLRVRARSLVRRTSLMAVTVKTPTVKASPLDVASIRKDFPILAQTVRGKPLVYLDNAATSQKPRQVIDAMSQVFEEHNANIHRGVYEFSERTTALFEEARAKVARLINAPSERANLLLRHANGRLTP